MNTLQPDSDFGHQHGPDRSARPRRRHLPHQAVPRPRRLPEVRSHRRWVEATSKERPYIRLATMSTKAQRRGSGSAGQKGGGPGGAALSPSSSSSSKTSTSPRSPFAPTLGGSYLERVILHPSRNDEYQGTAAGVTASGAEVRGAKGGRPGGGGHEPYGGPAARHGIVGEDLRRDPVMDDGAVENPDLRGRRSQAGNDATRAPGTAWAPTGRGRHHTSNAEERSLRPGGSRRLV